MKAQKIEKTPVIIVGGSLVGLSAAVFLAWQKVPFILIEKHKGSSPHPRAMGFPERTMELYRSVGIEEQIPQIDAHFELKRATVESLAGKWLAETEWTPQKKKDNEETKADYSPCMGAAIAQDKLEPILRKRALELGADLRLGTELLRFKQNENEVLVEVKDLDTGREYTIKADYMIAADGSASPIREALQIGRKGIGKLQVMRSVLFRAELNEYLASGFSQFEIEQPGLKAFLTTYQDNRWVLMFKDDLERNKEQLISDIQKAIGRKDIPIEIITTGRWDLSALISDKFKEGSVFLAGDAAHTLSPTRGGFGANTGIHDVHNLAWKLAAVVSGSSHPDLLETYHQERLPVAWVRYQQMFARPDYSKYISKEVLQNVKLYDDVSMELGQIYHSKGIINVAKNLPDARRPDQWNGQPGTRAPHFWITKNRIEISTIDLFLKGWTLLTANKKWDTAAKNILPQLKLKPDTVLLGKDIDAEDPKTFKKLFGIGENGAILIRPDGYIAWKATTVPQDAEQVLENVVRKVSFSK